MRRAGLKENRRRMYYTMITALGGTPPEAVGIFLKEALADRQRRKSYYDLGVRYELFHEGMIRSL